MADTRAYRASILHCVDDPAVAGAAAVESFEDGLLLVDGGRIEAVGPADALLRRIGPDVPVTDYSGRLLVPGLIDCHVHYPQVDMIASWGARLLDWLQSYAYPAERRYADPEYARAAADFFAGELLKNGTTTALVFASVHRVSAEAMFEAARRRNMRLVTGKVAMDTACPPDLRDSAEAAYRDSRELIERWHGVDRLGYAITPRFALTSSQQQLEALGRLAREFPDVHVHSHLAEQRDEVEAVLRGHPGSRSYLDVYGRHGLLRERSVFAHCLYLDDADRRELASSGGAIAFCPGSNLFLGSGLFDLAAADGAAIRTGIGSDVGAGTSLSLLQNLGEAYKVLQLKGQSLTPWKALHLATLGAARALRLEDRIGNFARGREADFVVLDPAATPLLARRNSTARDLAERFFALMMLGDERAVAATYLLGRCAWRRN
ncbi:MAG: guanine deaminase [Gammaproteobacteria bacterium]|nr:guanine deaminase [Gammaproteobacteria bacterium]MDH4256665.1 guanine deaminase [Gammaproteobacteria bacterium]MDH5309253.1 guanine deaminase [Gammaproteobacteria bacterium]